MKTGAVKIFGIFLAASMMMPEAVSAADVAREGMTETVYEEAQEEVSGREDADAGITGPAAEGAFQEAESAADEETGSEALPADSSAPDDEDDAGTPGTDRTENAEEASTEAPDGTTEDEPCGMAGESASGTAAVEEQAAEIVSVPGSGEIYGSGWVSDDDGTVCFMDETGRRVTGWRNIDGGRYYFDRYSGAMLTGFQTIGSRTYYFMDSQHPGYTAERAGRQMTGFQTIGGRTYYLMDERCEGYRPSVRGAVLSGFRTIAGRTYYLADSRMAGYSESNRNTVMTGFRMIGGKRYYLMDERCEGYRPSVRGVVLSGFRTIGGKRYYFADSRVKHYSETGKGAVVPGFRTVGNRLYHFSRSGVVTTGVLKSGGKIYYFGDDGARRTGWVTENGHTYYYYPSGEKLYGWRTISGKKYYFTKDNEIKKKCALIDGDFVYYLGKTGVPNQKFTRKASELLTLSPENRRKALVIIGNLITAAVEDQPSHVVVYDGKDLLKRDFTKINKVIDDTYYKCSVICYGTEKKNDDQLVGPIETYWTGRQIMEEYTACRAEEARFMAISAEHIKRAGVKDGDSAAGKVWKINDYLCDWLSYDGNVSYSFPECMKYRRGLCMNYAEAFYEMCTCAGIRCRIISGSAISGTWGNHAWNWVMIDGKWKYIDVTWNDAGKGRHRYYLSDTLWYNHRADIVIRDNRFRIG